VSAVHVDGNVMVIAPKEKGWTQNKDVFQIYNNVSHYSFLLRKLRIFLDQYFNKFYCMQCYHHYI